MISYEESSVIHVSKHLSWLYILQPKTACFYMQFCGAFGEPVSSGMFQASKRSVFVPLVLGSQKKKITRQIYVLVREYGYNFGLRVSA